MYEHPRDGCPCRTNARACLSFWMHQAALQHIRWKYTSKAGACMRHALGDHTQHGPTDNANQGIMSMRATTFHGFICILYLSSHLLNHWAKRPRQSLRPRPTGYAPNIMQHHRSCACLGYCSAPTMVVVKPCGALKRPRESLTATTTESRRAKQPFVYTTRHH